MKQDKSMAYTLTGMDLLEGTKQAATALDLSED